MANKENKSTNIQISFRYDGERGNMIEGYAYGTRRRLSDIAREAMDEYYANHEADIIAKSVPTLV